MVEVVGQVEMARAGEGRSHRLGEVPAGKGCPGEDRRLDKDPGGAGREAESSRGSEAVHPREGQTLPLRFRSYCLSYDAHVLACLP